MTGFCDIIGQEPVTRVLKNAVRTGKIPHAIIFDGEKGCGKKTLAKAFAAACSCEALQDNAGEGPEPCGKCHSCIMAENGSHPDIITVTHEKNAIIAVDEIRAQVVNDVQIKPYYGGRKIYIIPDAHLMTHQAQNALLKTLEEPPGYVVILLLADNKDLLLPTLLSRSVCLSFIPVERENILKILSKNGIPVSGREDISSIVSYARGNPGRALFLSNSEKFADFWKDSLQILKGVRKMTDREISSAAAKIAANRKERGENLSDYLTLFLLWYRDIMYLKADGGEDKLIFPEEAAFLRRAGEEYSFEKLNGIIEGIKEAGSYLDSNVQPESTFELLFMKMR